MRIDVRKFLFLGVHGIKEKFFEEAQELGVIEFIDKRASAGFELPQEVHRTSQAIKVVRGLQVTEQEELDDFSKADDIVSNILRIKHKLEQLEEEKRILYQEMARIEIFGDFATEDVKWIQNETGRFVQFYCTKKDSEVPAREKEEMLQVGSDHGLDYFVAFNRQPTNYEGMIEMHIEKPVGQLHRRFEAVLNEVHTTDQELKTYSRFNDYLHRAFVEKMNDSNLVHAKAGTQEMMDNSLFVVEAWVSESSVEAMQQLGEEFDVHVEEIAIADEDKVPTFLANEGASRIGEDLVHIYDTPSTTDKDPSLWVLWSFALFFSIILGDGGYGFIFLAVSIFLFFKFPNATGVAKRIMKLTSILSVSCIVWGVLTNSFFGMHFDIDSQVRQVSVVQWMAEKKAAYHMDQKDDVFENWTAKYPQIAAATDPKEFLAGASVEVKGRTVYPMLDRFSDNIMLELALFIGVIHISLSFLRSIRGAWSGLGWISFMAGAYLYFPSMLNATSMIHFIGGVEKVAGAAAGYELLLGGIGAALLLGIIQHGFAGLLELMNLIQVFSDVLSYLRLYALGLAGSMMSSTFNDIGGSMTLVAGVIVIIIGHIVNIVLSIMGGVIHGLRLNFLEWYHYCFEGGGKLFRPLKRY